METTNMKTLNNKNRMVGFAITLFVAAMFLIGSSPITSPTSTQGRTTISSHSTIQVADGSESNGGKGGKGGAGIVAAA